ncbi:hypothetical protein [Litoreibacter meonggei]|uniref:hypothetical protein n=1 Tax=Litoreibacter meonggei TaxID=1049199 RepID=UPI000EAF2E72|nr:hypothetical protein [Litoreibacter meonggei]
MAKWGLVVVALPAYFSCLAVPVPTSAVMLAGGAFAAAGDQVLRQAVSVAYVWPWRGTRRGSSWAGLLTSVVVLLWRRLRWCNWGGSGEGV